MLDIDNPGKENVLFHYEGKKVIQTVPTCVTTKESSVIKITIGGAGHLLTDRLVV